MRVFRFAIIVAALTGCLRPDDKEIIEKGEHHLTLAKGDALVKVEIIDATIIHIVKGRDSLKTSVPDYVTQLKPQKVAWSHKRRGNDLIVSTKLVSVTIDAGGTISFHDSDGRQLLAESPSGTVIHTENADHEVSQSFVAGDEGLYGLGQYQNGIMNWKNVPLRMTQFNQEIVVPFLISTHDYGIYWHNYSVTDFNRPENEITFSITQDQEKNIRKAVFTPARTGLYHFFVDSPNPKKNRFNGPIVVTLNGDTVIHYSTVWVPDCHTGQKYLEAGETYEVIFQNTDAQVPGGLFYNEPGFNKTVFSSRKGNTVDYFFIHGSGPKEIISGYQRLTGSAPLFARSAYGFWQCRERYHHQQELLENAREYRKRGIPIDNIVQDWFYWPEDTKGPEWDRKKYPDPAAMVDELEELNLQLMVSVWPEVINEPLLKKYHLDHAKLRNTHYLDLYDSDVQRNYYRMLSDSMFHFGVTSIWLDGTEPEKKPLDTTQTAGGSFAEVANAYSLLVNQAMYEGRRKEYPDQRVFNLTRSAYAGQQRYGATSWSGDVAATWEQFAEQIPAGLNFAMAGIPYWTTDIGGFFRDRNSLNPIFDDQYTDPEFIELLTRWFQFGAFNPVFRIHGYVSNTEVWRYGPRFESIARKFIDLRYQMLPYIYSEAWKVTSKNQLMMRPLVYDYPNDKNTWGVTDQYLFGDCFLVSPVTCYQCREREVYLPAGDWYNFWTHEKVTGGKELKTPAPLDQIPLYVKAGSIVPMGPRVQYATEPTDEPVVIHIYPGQDAEYVLYLDDNESTRYEKGEFTELVLQYNEDSATLSVDKGNGSYVDFSVSPFRFEAEVVGTGLRRAEVFEGTLKTLHFSPE